MTEQIIAFCLWFLSVEKSLLDLSHCCLHLQFSSFSLLNSTQVFATVSLLYLSNGHLDCFTFGASKNKVTKNI